MSPKLAQNAFVRSILLIKITAVAVAMVAVLLLFMVSTSQASTLNNYQESEVLVASEGESEDAADLGRSVAVSGDTVVVGAPNAVGGTGKVFVYVRPTTGWADVTATETATLTLPAGEIVGQTNFGSAVDISGDTIVVGATGAEFGNGAAYVYVRPEAGWSPTYTYVASLTHPTELLTGEDFGQSVAISGDTIAVGAPGAGGGPGRAYVFERPVTGWEPAVASVVLSYTLSGDEDKFGFSVATHADTVVVGAPGTDVDANNNQGAAYVYEKPLAGWASTGTPTEILTFPGDADDNLGRSVDIREDGRVIVTGADASDANSGQGAAYVYVREGSTWATAGTLISDTLTSGAAGSAQNLFGHSVSISGDTIVVGAPEFRTTPDGEAELKAGAAFVYIQPNAGPEVAEEDLWEDTDAADEILFDDTARSVDDAFGAAVAAFGGTVVVGVPGDDLPADDGSTNQGSARVFENVACSAQSGDWGTADTWVGDSVPVDTADVCISTGNMVTLNSETQVRRLLVNPGAQLHLPTSGFTATQQVVNQGTLVQQKTHTPGLWGTEMLKIVQSESGFTVFRGADISSTAELGGVTLTLRTTVDWFSPTAEFNRCTTDGSNPINYAGRCFDLEPDVKDEAADIRLWVREDELNDIPSGDLVVYRFNDGNWQVLDSNVDDVGYQGIGYINVTASTPGFSDFLVGDQDSEPTAVNLMDFTAADAVQNMAVVAILLALAITGGLTMALLLRRQKAKQASR